MLAGHFHQIHQIMLRGDHHMCDQVSAEARNTVSAISQAAQDFVEQVAGPVWGDLTAEVREACSVAGMMQDDRVQPDESVTEFIVQEFVFERWEDRYSKADSQDGRTTLDKAKRAFPDSSWRLIRRELCHTEL